MTDTRTSVASREINRVYRLALVCGALPLLGGVSIFLLWLLTRRWDWLMMASVFAIYGGVVVFFIGAIALARFCWLAFRTPDLPRQRVWLSIVGWGVLLLANFPAAAGITAAASAIETRYTVIVHNTSPQPLTGVRVFGGGCEADFGTIPPAGIARHSFWIRHDGELEFRAASAATTYAQTIDHVTDSLGGHTTVTINPDGTMSVSSKTAS